MDNLRIFLGDLTYDTVAISTEAMPLNVGYIASYCKKKFGDRVEISLFKYFRKTNLNIINYSNLKHTPSIVF